ncbi:MAG: DUF167 domain-containing protein [Betaproteobacteria bacterium]
MYAQPGARTTEIQGLHDGALKIRVAAPPLDGRANDEIARFLGTTLNVPARDICLVSGAKSRSKRYSISGACNESLADIESKL